MGHFADAGAVAGGVAHYIGRTPSVLFSLALIDASIIGAAAVSLSTAYAVGDVLSLKHSLHRKPGDAKAFYGVYAILIAISAGLVLMPNAPLGLITNAVQTLAGILLPSATVFLLLLCNDKDVLGPWVNSRGTNVFTSVVVMVLVLLSVVLTASVLFPDITGSQIVDIIVAGAGVAALLGLALLFGPRRVYRRKSNASRYSREVRAQWRMPSLDQLPPVVMSVQRKVWLGILRSYLFIALLMAIVKIASVLLAPH